MKFYTNLLKVIFTLIILISVDSLYAQYPVSGYVLYSDDLTPVTSGYVNAYSATDFSLIQQTNINPDGSYLFAALPTELTDVFGLPEIEPEGEGIFVPTYHPNKQDFAQAQQIYPDQPLNNVNILVQRVLSGGNNPLGLSFIGGNVKLENQGIKDAIIYAMQGEKCFGYAISDVKGNFKIKNLPSGEYILGVHRIGCVYSNMSVILNSKGIDNISFSIEKAKPALSSPGQFSLSQNFPNPFNPATKIMYSVAKDGLVKLAVYDVEGRLVKLLVNENKQSGNYTVVFDGTELASGVYFYKLTAGNFVETKKLTLIK